jgi:prolyl oligopeptidase
MKPVSVCRVFAPAFARNFALAFGPLSLLACGGDSSDGPSAKVAMGPVVDLAKPAPAVAQAAPAKAPSDDELLWLEEVTGDKAMSFAKAHNAKSEAWLTGQPIYKTLHERLLAIYTSKDRIPAVVQQDKWLYNFWVDGEHPRGLWRRTTWADYRKKDPAWEVVLDIDALGKAENESWVFKGADCLKPKFTRCLMKLSRGGGDAVVVREFDTTKKAFVEGGFKVDEAKSDTAWKDADTIYVGTNFGEGTLTKSGYPRFVKEWKRGTPIASATTVYEAKIDDVVASGKRDYNRGRPRHWIVREIDFEHDEMFLVKNGKLVKLDKPDDAEARAWDDELLLRTKSDWKVGDKTFKKGSLVVTKLDAFLAGKRDFTVLFEPTKTTSLASWTGTKSAVVLNVLSDVKNEVSLFRRNGKTWKSEKLEGVSGTVQVSAVDDDASDDAWLWQDDFVTPVTLTLWNTATKKKENLKQNPAFFDAKGMAMTQHFATSKDGTKIPYFQVGKQDSNGWGGGPRPTLISAYGGFEISLMPSYNATVGAAWLEAGGVFVQANLRGGGEYGPAWHEAAMKSARHKAYEDCIAVAEDLVSRKVTTSDKLGIRGGSNGGLLTSVMLTQRPDLFGAVVSAVPLTDMKRFHKLLAGASWMAEYGNPDDPADWGYLAKYSPLHNAKAAAKYPPVFYTTSTKDDRVHPGHARKMVAMLEALGHSPLYYENIEGGHAGAADIKQRAHVSALEYTFLHTTLMPKGLR